MFEAGKTDSCLNILKCSKQKTEPRFETRAIYPSSLGISLFSIGSTCGSALDLNSTVWVSHAQNPHLGLSLWLKGASAQVIVWVLLQSYFERVPPSSNELQQILLKRRVLNGPFLVLWKFWVGCRFRNILDLHNICILAMKYCVSFLLH